MNAILPEQLETIHVADMLVGESGYVASHAMMVDGDGQCWLREGFTFERESHEREILGIPQRRIKVTRANDGYVVSVPSDCRYEKGGVTAWHHRTWGLVPVVRLEVTHE